MFITDINDRIMCKTKSGNKIYWMLTQGNGAPNFELRYIEIPSNGKSSYGKHPHEHEVFVQFKRRMSHQLEFIGRVDLVRILRRPFACNKSQFVISILFIWADCEQIHFLRIVDQIRILLSAFSCNKC